MKSDRSLNGRGSCGSYPSEEVTGHRYITQTKHPPLPIASRHKTEKIVR